MVYTIDKAELIGEQLRRFTTGKAHHVVGQFSNLDFWFGEVVAALKVIDDYGARFDRMAEAQSVWLDRHQIVELDYCAQCRGPCELEGEVYRPPRAPTRYRRTEFKKARKTLVDSAYFFLARCARLNLLSEERLKRLCEEMGTSLDRNDI